MGEIREILERIVVARPFPQKRLRLFMSVDFSGSTAYKQAYPPQRATDSDPQPWLVPFADFFPSIERELINEWEKLFAKASEEGVESYLYHSVPFYVSNLTTDTVKPDKARPRHWKALGDESIFVLKIENPLQVLVAIEAFQAATRKIRHGIMARGWQPLNVKATAWLAGFPVNNSEFVMGRYKQETKEGAIWPSDAMMFHHYLRPLLFRIGRANLLQRVRNEFSAIKLYSDEALHQYIDYMGPQMDVGFRLTKKSTPHKMMISADLAYLLARTLYKSGESMATGTTATESLRDISDNPGLKSFVYQRTVAAKGDNEERKREATFRFFYDGRQALEGVRNGIPYPLIWLANDSQDSLIRAEDNLSNHKDSARERDILVFTKSFLESSPRPKSMHDDTRHGPIESWMMRPHIEGWNLSDPLGKEDDETSGFSKWHQDRYAIITGFVANGIQSPRTIPVVEPQLGTGEPPSIPQYFRHPSAS